MEGKIVYLIIMKINKPGIKHQEMDRLTKLSNGGELLNEDVRKYNDRFGNAISMYCPQTFNLIVKFIDKKIK